MFTSKKTQLFETPVKATKGSNTTSATSTFVSAAMKKGAETRSQNGALKYSTSFMCKLS